MQTTQFLHESTQRYGIWNKRGFFPPRKYFKTHLEASCAAEQMSAAHPDQGKFHVVLFVEKVSVLPTQAEAVA